MTSNYFQTFIHVLLLSTTTASSSFHNYKLKYNKTYSSIQEESKAKETYYLNNQLIKRHNKKYFLKQSSYYLGHNEFSDLTSKEFQTLYLMDGDQQQQQQQTTTNNNKQQSHDNNNNNNITGNDYD